MFDSLNRRAFMGAITKLSAVVGVGRIAKKVVGWSGEPEGFQGIITEDVIVGTVSIRISGRRSYDLVFPYNVRVESIEVDRRAKQSDKRGRPAISQVSLYGKSHHFSVRFNSVFLGTTVHEPRRMEIAAGFPVFVTANDPLDIITISGKIIEKPC